MEHKNDCMCDACIIARKKVEIADREYDRQRNGPLTEYEIRRGGKVMPPRREPKAK